MREFGSWMKSVENYLQTWAGNGVNEYPDIDFHEAHVNGDAPWDASQDAIDIQSWINDAKGS